MNPFEHQSPIEGVKRIIVVGSGKGGVGKSTVTVNLAKALEQQGRQVGILDADIYGPSLPRMLGALNQKPSTENNKLFPLVRHGLKLMSMGFLIPENSAVVWRGPMLFKAMDQFLRDVVWGSLDELLIDLPPGTGDVALTIAQKVPVHGALIVCTPQNLAFIDARRAMDMFERIDVPLLGVVENMSYWQQGDGEKVDLFLRGEMDSYLKVKEIQKLAEVPFNPNLGISSESGIPIVESSPNSLESKAFFQLAQKLIHQDE